MNIEWARAGRLIGIGSLLWSGLASACMQDQPARGQILISQKLGALPGTGIEIPDERVLQAGDLVTLLGTSSAVVTPIDSRGSADPILVPLDEARYLDLSAQGGGKAFPDLGAMHLPVPVGPGGPASPGMDLRRFGAARAGLVYLRISYAGRTQLVRLEIAPAKVIPRGRVVRGTETTAADPLWLESSDTLVLELPGDPGDGWSVTPTDDTGFKLASIEAVDASAPGQLVGASPHRVRLRFTQTSSQSSTRPEVKLQAKGGRNSFTFTLRHQPTPTC